MVHSFTGRGSPQLNARFQLATLERGGIHRTMGIVTHERILCAVGRVLDLVDAQSFSIAETTNGGLRLDYIASTGVAQTLDLSLNDISDLIEWRPASADRQAGHAP